MPVVCPCSFRISDESVDSMLRGRIAMHNDLKRRFSVQFGVEREL